MNERDRHDRPAVDPPDPAADRDGAAGALGDTAVAGTARKAPRRVRTGDALGRYELGEELGEGGMATVYRARDRELRRDVAVKVLFPHLARRPDIVRRFHREARAAAGLEHPNILRIYDVGGGDAGDPPYIVMELVRGRTLLQEIEQRGAMLAEVAACVGALLGDALAAAHAAGIVHRDVKPANVLIAPGGRLLLGDFGVARLETEDSLVTRTGALLGTPAYMSPEQASGDIATARSDLYSLGATLYQLATGALPYAGPPARVMSMIATGSLAPAVRRRPACGPDLSRRIERLMALDPGARPASATVLAAELRALVAGSGLGDPSEELAAYFEDPDGFLRARTPVVVAALVAAANAAITEAKLPRAMALADRASALSPADPAVVALIRSVTEGGHASRRKRALAISGVALAAVGGVAALGWQLSSGHDAAEPAGHPGSAATAGSGAVPDAADRAAAGPASDPAPGPGSSAASAAAPGPGSSAASGAATGAVDRAAAEPGSDAPAPLPGRDRTTARVPAAAAAGRLVDRRGSAGGPAIPRAPARHPRDAAVEVPVDPSALAAPATVAAGSAAPAASPSPPAAPPPTDAGSPPPAAGQLVVHNDVWCNIYVDGNLYGNRRNERIGLGAGHHVVRCVNPSVGEWTQPAEIAPGTTLTVTGTLLRPIEVRLDVEATIDGKHYARGAVVRLTPGNIEVIAGGKKQFITLRASCTLKATPELGCYL